jgi:TolA-binding protein
VHLLDQTYTYGQSEIHLGEKFFIEVEDLDRDRKVKIEPDTDMPDAKPVWRERPNKITVQVQSIDPESGEVHHTVDYELPETGRNTGVFSRSIEPAYYSFKAGAAVTEDVEKQGEGAEGQPKPGSSSANPTDRKDTILVDFGDRVVVSYKDSQNVSYDEDRVISAEGKIFKGADTDLSCYTKKFEDLEMAVKTQFLTAEALFEMAKKFRKIDKKDQASQRMQQGKRVLEEALRDYPQSEYIQQGLFLLATLEQQMGEVNYSKMEKLKKDNEDVFKSDQEHPIKKQYAELKRERDRHYEEATKRFTSILSKYPDSDYAPRSQFKKAVCLERKGNYDAACEEYVKVTYLYPNHELVPKATARLGNHFFGIKKYDVAAEVFFKFQQRYPQHEVAPKALLLSGQAYMKMKKFEDASRVLTLLKNNYEDALQQRAEGLYWLGRSYEAVNDFESAYKAFKVLTWDHPETNWAKHARAKLIDKKYKAFEE